MYTPNVNIYYDEPHDNLSIYCYSPLKHEKGVVSDTENHYSKLQKNERRRWRAFGDVRNFHS